MNTLLLQQEINNLRHTTELYEAVKIDKKQLEIEIYQLKDQLDRVMEHNEKLVKLNADLDQRLTAIGHRERRQHVTPQFVAPAPPGQLPVYPIGGPAVMQEVRNLHCYHVVVSLPKCLISKIKMGKLQTMIVKFVNN